MHETPVEFSPVLSELTGATVSLKLENLQVTGSFKARGAFNRLLALAEGERARGFITASSGNHGAAVAYAAKKLGIDGIIFVPENVAPLKLENIRRLGGNVRIFGVEGGVTEVHARAYANEHGMTYISPYNDPLVIAGQGTIGAEIARQVASVDVIVASVGGGGLICGTAGYLKAIRLGRVAIGVSARNSMAMAASVRAGRIIETEHLPTLSDGTAGGVEPGAITFDLCRELVDEFVEVSEDEIAAALRLFIEAHHMLCEGAAAVAVAGMLRAKDRLRGKNVVAVICGANISADQLKVAL
ncbi:MAG: threonine/serine dehydratase [Candidatus Eremiobacteraeota bacterium]|nr:threonine/serine dehydratase [Candidatus Eremiobacteraeota bacterium]